ncbi:MAG: Mce-associated rane protein [Mycobacterium sp.]|nr:Mce-associated rane protein [Mycobacterium sp.]
MEGDAGASRLNPIDEDDSLGTEVTAEDSKKSEAGADPTSSEVTAEDSDGAEDPTSAETVADDDVRRPSRLNRVWLAGIAAVLVIFAGAIAGGGYMALRYNQQINEISHNDAAALQLAKDCVAATQAPDITSIAASEQKIIDCGTDQYRTQALLYSSMLVQAYQAANVHLQVSDMRAAVERNNPDGTIDVLIAVRVKVSNDQAQDQETGYRLRVKMTPTDGSYKISKLDQVTK